MGDKPEFKQDVILRLERIEKLLNEGSQETLTERQLMQRMKTSKNAYLTKLNNKDILQPKPTTLEYYKIKYDEETKTYS